MIAAISGSDKVVRELLDYGANVHNMTNNNYNAVMAVSYVPGSVTDEKSQRYFTTLGLLFRSGANLEEKFNGFDDGTCRGFTALMWAARSGNVVVTKALISVGANLDALSNNKTSALIWASGECFGTTQSMYRVQPGYAYHTKEHCYQIMKSLIDAGVDIDVVSEYGENAIAAARKSGNEEGFRLLTEKKRGN